jgi:hypothetical protein
MKKLFLIFFVIFNTISVHSQLCEWALNISGKDYDYISDFITDKYGNFYIIVNFTSDTLFFNNGKYFIKEKINGSSWNYNIFLAKYNSDSKLIWAEKIDGGELVYANCISLDSLGNIYIGGRFGSDTLNFNNNISITNKNLGFYNAFFAKYNNDGLCQWAESINGYSQIEISGIEIDSHNDLIVAGQFNSYTATFNNGFKLNNYGIWGECYDGFIAKYSNNGLCKGVQQIKGNGSDYIERLKLDKNDNIYIEGSFDSDTIIFNKELYFRSKLGQYFFENFKATYNTNGDCLWAEKKETELNYILDNDSNAYYFGSFKGDSIKFKNTKPIYNSSSSTNSSDAVLYKFNKTGDLLWVETINGYRNESITNITFDNENNLYLAGTVNSAKIYFNNGISLYNSLYFEDNLFEEKLGFIAKYDKNGQCQWAELIQGYGNNLVNNIILSNDNSIIIYGNYYSKDIKFNNNKKLINANNVDKRNDIYIAKYSQKVSSVADKYQSNIILSPNPANDFITINIQPSEGLEPSEGYVVQIFNTLGIEVGQSSMIDDKNRIDISHLPTGIYFIRIPGSNGACSIVEKFVKM